MTKSISPLRHGSEPTVSSPAYTGANQLTSGEKTIFDSKDSTSNKYGIYRVKLDGSGKTQIVSNTNSDFILYNNSIYYVSKSNLCSMDSDDPSSIKILKENFLGRLVGIENGWVYSEIGYATDANTSGIYRINLIGNDQEKIFSKAVSNLIPHSDALYFISGQRLMKSKSDGSETIELLNTEMKNFSIFEETLCYVISNKTDNSLEIHEYDLTTYQDTILSTFSKDKIFKDLNVASFNSASALTTNISVPNIGVTYSTIYLELSHSNGSYIFAFDKKNIDKGYLLSKRFSE